MPEKLYIIDFETVETAVDFAKENWPESMAWEEMYAENEGNEAWVCVIGVCDICKWKNVFFAPACIYDSGVSGVECPECENMSVYPVEEEIDNV